MLTSLLLSVFLLAPQEPSTLRDSLEKARSLVLAGHGHSAEEQIDQLFEDHVGNELVLRHLPVIVDVLLDSLFLQERALDAPPESGEGIPDIPFHAEVLSYKEKTGKFELRWEGRSQLGDFEMAKESLRFPLKLGTKFRIGLLLRAYPETTQIRILIDNEDGQKFEIDCGLGVEGLNRTIAKVYQVTEGRFELLDREDKKLPTPGKEVMLQVKGVGRAVQIYLGNKKLLNFKIGKGDIGFITFEGLDKDVVTAVEYAGPLDLVALADVIEEIQIQNRESFRSRVDLKEHLPDWVYPFLKTSGSDLRDLSPPDAVHGSESGAAWAEALSFIQQVRLTSLPIISLSIMQDDPPKGLTAVQQEYASLRMAFEGGYWSYAKGHARNVLRTHPNHLPTQMTMLQSIAFTGDALACWTTAKAYFAKSQEEALILMATQCLLRGQLVEELEVYLEEEESLPEALLARCRVLLDQRSAPTTPGMQTMSGPYVEITSDLPEERIQELSQWMSQEVGRAKKFFPEGLWPEEVPLRVFLFADRWDYEEYVFDIIHLAHPSSSGFYAQEFDAVLAWDHRNEDELKATLRRELMIQVGKHIHPDYPVWASIGLAQIVADRAIVPKQKLKRLSKISARMVRDAKQDDLVPFPMMLHLSDSAFYFSQAERNMEVQAWLMMLAISLSEEDAQLGVWKELLLGLTEGMSWAEAVDGIFEEWGTAEGGSRDYERLVKRISNLSAK